MPNAIVKIEPPSEEYLAVAKRLGVRVNGLTRTTMLEAVLQDEHARLYSLPAVEKYMARVTPSGKVWGWAAVRAVDRSRSKGVRFGHNDCNGRFLDGLYDKPIPLPALLTMEKIENAMAHLPEPQRPAFFVTDYAVPSPDPFLMVATPGVSPIQHPKPDGRLWRAIEGVCFVIERWDEPSFR